MGFLIGLIMGILAGYDTAGVGQLAVQTGAVMVLMPKMVALLMEGLTPISESANEFVKKRFPGRELYIGMDAALSVGHPAVLSSSLLLVPITILLAVILPGNTTLPFGDLATIPFLICLMAAVFGGNIIRTVIAGTIYMVSILYITSWAAPLVTTAARSANFDLQGNSMITAMAEGGLWTTFLYDVNPLLEIDGFEIVAVLDFSDAVSLIVQVLVPLFLHCFRWHRPRDVMDGADTPAPCWHCFMGHDDLMSEGGMEVNYSLIAHNSSGRRNIIAHVVAQIMRDGEGDQFILQRETIRWRCRRR